ncbi:MAG: sulfite exporter TauE/SafE family protein [Dehalococcoidia bacterium]
MDFPDIGVIVWASFVGVLVGLTGIGLGPIGTPGLLLFFPISETAAVASNIVAGSASKITGAAVYQKHGLVVWSVALVYIVGGFPTLILGSYMLDLLGDNDLFKPIVGVVLLAAAIALGLRYFILREPPRTLEVTRAKVVGAGVLGAVIGFVVGLTSIGTGSLTIAGFLTLLRLPANYVVGTTLVTAPVFLAISAVSHIFFGNVEWGLTANLFLGLVIGIFAGSYFAPKFPRQILRLGITGFLAAAAVLLIASVGGE